jgi:hypothetical protein
MSMIVLTHAPEPRAFADSALRVATRLWRAAAVVG